jgi:hypothetical protein
MREDGAVETKEFGPGHYFMPLIILPDEAGIEMKNKLKALEAEYTDEKNLLRKKFNNKLRSVATFMSIE